MVLTKGVHKSEIENTVSKFPVECILLIFTKEEARLLQTLVNGVDMRGAVEAHALLDQAIQKWSKMPIDRKDIMREFITTIDTQISLSALELWGVERHDDLIRIDRFVEISKQKMRYDQQRKAMEIWEGIQNKMLATYHIKGFVGTNANVFIKQMNSLFKKMEDAQRESMILAEIKKRVKTDPGAFEEFRQRWKNIKDKKMVILERNPTFTDSEASKLVAELDANLKK